MFQHLDESATIKKLYPHLSPDELSEVDDTLRQYLDVVKRIYDDVSANDPKVLTELRRRARLRKKGEKSA